MRILDVEIQDILSVQKAHVPFEDNGLVLVEGWNYDTNRANGAGKTALLNCVAFGLYDKLPRKITASEILRRGCKTGFVKTRVLCGDDVWTVQRSRPKGVKFWKNDVEQDITQDEFESHIRLTYRQFLLTIYTPQANSGWLVRFLSSPDTSKKEFLLQLLNLDKFSSVKKAVDETIKRLQASVDHENQKVANARARIEAYEESAIDEAAVIATIKTAEEILLTTQDELITLCLVPKPDLSKYTKVEEDIRTKQAEIAQAKARRGMLHERYRELNAAIRDYDSDIACGECGSSLDTPEARTTHTDHQDKTKQKAVDIKNQIDAADLIISKEQTVTDLARKLRDKKQKESADFQAAQLRIADLRSFARTHETTVHSGHLKLTSAAELASKIKDLKSKVDISLLIVSNNKKELELYKTLSAIYSPTGAQAYVLDSVVDSFNEVIQKYIDIMAPDMSYTLNSFKENSDGDVVAKFSETLVKAGKDVSVGSLSGGEEKGLSLCVDFALLEVLETQFGMTLNPIILDEPFDGLDIAGREIVINLLENLARARQIFVVDHASEAKALFTKTLRVELRNDISTIKVET